MENKNRLIQVSYCLQEVDRISELFEKDVMYKNVQELQKKGLGMCTRYTVKMKGVDRSQNYFIFPGLNVEITDTNIFPPIDVIGTKENIEEGKPILERLLGEEVFMEGVK